MFRNFVIAVADLALETTIAVFVLGPVAGLALVVIGHAVKGTIESR